MPKQKRPRNYGAKLPEFLKVSIDQIIEPELAARATMDEHKMADLVESFQTVGQIEPITLERKDGMMEIISGHRRYLAARQLRWPTIAAVVYDEGAADVLAMRLHENTVREDLNPAEEAIFMREAQDKLRLDEAGLCKMFHRSADYVAGRLALLRGDPEIFAAVQKQQIKLGVAHQLNRIDDDQMRHYYLHQARLSDPPARVVHEWVESWKNTVRPPLPMPPAGESIDGTTPAGADANLVQMAPNPGQGQVDLGPPAPQFGCQLCGGNRDPYNLVSVMIHKWEWESLLQQVRKAAGGQV